jgi:hypothetical protein
MLGFVPQPNLRRLRKIFVYPLYLELYQEFFRMYLGDTLTDAQMKNRSQSGRTHDNTKIATSNQPEAEIMTAQGF